jgi:anhydro-N-acetylmuramic acid kinase
MWVIGALSGTSADGVSACLARIAGEGTETRVRVASFRRDAFPRTLTERIHRLAAGALAGDALLRELIALDTLLGERFARTIVALQSAAPPGGRARLAGLHGQTIVHLPRRRVGRANEAGTLQIGNAAIVAEATGLDVVSDLRRRDMAVGGEGAPLVPILDHALYSKRGVRRALVNIGGIANVTLLPGTGRASDVRAFDTGPGNMLLDSTVRGATRGRLAYDRGGRLALAGRVSQKLFARLLAHPFLAAPPPKSADRGDFEGAWWADIVRRARARLSLEDFLATLVALTAHAIVEGIERGSEGSVPDEVLVSGGGAHNRALLAAIQERLPGSTLRALPKGGEDKEALLFAFLAREFVLGRPANLPAVTGASRPALLGVLTPGVRFRPRASRQAPSQARAPKKPRGTTTKSPRHRPTRATPLGSR